MQSTIIYGAGCQGQSLLRLLNTRPEPPLFHCFLDGNPAKQGQFLEGYPIYAPDYLLDIDPEGFQILVAVGEHYPAVRRLLEGLGLQEGCHFQDATQRPLPFAEIDPSFVELLRKVRPHTLLSEDRLGLLYQFARRTRSLPGDAAEVGVYKGGTAFLIASALVDTDKQVHLFDTFCGLPDADPNTDLHRQGDFGDTCLEEVGSLLEPFPGCRLHPGLFPASLPAGWGEKSFSFVHVDVDIYQSALDCCEFFFPRLVPGGFMVFDDYGFVSCPGIRRALDDYFTSAPDQILYLPTGQAMAIKS
ncbi:MAG: TylF/MycF/NovP-related O-methyltransferase [Syntrophotaleaceae bacterium]